MHSKTSQCITAHHSALQRIRRHPMALQDILQCITSHHSALQRITMHYRALQDILQCIIKHNSASQCTTAHHKTPHDITRHLTVHHKTSQRITMHHMTTRGSKPESERAPSFHTPYFSRYRSLCKSTEEESPKSHVSMQKYRGRENTDTNPHIRTNLRTNTTELASG